MQCIREGGRGRGRGRGREKERERERERDDPALMQRVRERARDGERGRESERERERERERESAPPRSSTTSSLNSRHPFLMARAAGQVALPFLSATAFVGIRFDG